MLVTIEQVEKQALQLRPDELAELTERLLESLEIETSKFSEEWRLEIEKRVMAFENGTSITHSALDVFAEANQLISK